MRVMKRRDFIKVTGSSALACSVFGLMACKQKETTPAPAKVEAEYSWRFFTDRNEKDLARTVILRMLPADPESRAPSADDLHVLEYLDGQLAEPHFRELHRMMHGGFNFIDRVSTKRFGGTFLSRSPEVQDKILGQFQTGAIKGLKFPQERFFETLRSFALEGYWSHPKYGGNFEKKAWSWVSINPHCSHIHGSCTE
jgi:hypothetical protein